MPLALATLSASSTTSASAHYSRVNIASNDESPCYAAVKASGAAGRDIERNDGGYNIGFGQTALEQLWVPYPVLKTYDLNSIACIGRDGLCGVFCVLAFGAAQDDVRAAKPFIIGAKIYAR